MPDLDPFRPASLEAPVSPSSAPRPPRKNPRKAATAAKPAKGRSGRKPKDTHDAAIKDAIDNVINAPKRGRKPRAVAAPAKVRKPRVAKVPKSGKLGINEIVQATVGLKELEAAMLLRIYQGLEDFNKKGRAKIVAALAKLFA